MAQYNKALEFAMRAHKGQARKGTDLPYIVHPIRVAELVRKFGGGSHDVVVALLHDVVEDSDVTLEDIEEEFGLGISRGVEALTDSDEELKDLSKLELHKKKFLTFNNTCYLVKLCDRLDNIADKPSKKQVYSTLELLTYLETTVGGLTSIDSFRNLVKTLKTELVKQLTKIKQERR